MTWKYFYVDSFFFCWFAVLWFAISIRSICTALMALIKSPFLNGSHGRALLLLTQWTEEKMFLLESRFYFGKAVGADTTQVVDFGCVFFSFLFCFWSPFIENAISSDEYVYRSVSLCLLKISLIANRAFWQCKTYELIYQSHSYLITSNSHLTHNSRIDG